MYLYLVPLLAIFYLIPSAQMVFMLEQVARETNQKVVNQKSQIQTFYASLHAAIDLTIRISLTRPIAVLPQLWLFPTLGNIRGREPHHQQPWLYCLWGSFHPYGRLCFLEYACLA